MWLCTCSGSLLMPFLVLSLPVPVTVYSSVLKPSGPHEAQEAASWVPSETHLRVNLLVFVPRRLEFFRVGTTSFFRTLVCPEPIMRPDILELLNKHMRVTY